MKWTLMLALAVALVVPSVAAAHEGHAHKTMGTVTMVHQNHVEVKDAQGKTATFELSAKTKVTRGKMVVRADDIKVGDRVVVTATETKDKDGKSVVNVSSVQLGTAAAAKAGTKQ